MLFEEGALPLEPINFSVGCNVRSSTRRPRSVRPCEPELRVVVAFVWREAAAELYCGASRHSGPSCLFFSCRAVNADGLSGGRAAADSRGSALV